VTVNQSRPKSAGAVRCRAVVDGDWIFVAGTTGYDYATMTLADVVRVTYILPDATEFPQCWPVLRQAFGEIRPAATMLSAGLHDPEMRIEIEVTARKQREAPVSWSAANFRNRPTNRLDSRLPGAE